MSVTLGVPDSEATKKLAGLETPPAIEPVVPPQPQPQIQIVKEYPDDLKAVIEKARKEEKDKLYDRIRRAEAIESENAALKSRAADLEKSNADLGRQIEETGKKKASKKNDNADDLDIQALIQDTASAVTKQLEAKFAQERATFQAQIESLQKKMTGNDLNALRDRLIAEANGQIIAALVRGNTEDEIRQSVLEAKAEYERVVKSVSGHAPVQPASSTATAPLPNVPSATGNQPAAPTPMGRGVLTSPGADGVPALSEAQQFKDDVRKLTPEEYKKNRKSILAKMKGYYPSIDNPVLR